MSEASNDAPVTLPAAEPADVYLHVGAMNSGASYLQSVLRTNWQALAEGGVLWPKGVAAGAVDALGRKPNRRIKESEGEWSRVVDQIGAWEGRAAVLSQEFLCGASAEEAQHVVDSLRGHRLTVIITVPDLTRAIPSHWQTVIKGDKGWSFPEYMQTVLSDVEEESPQGPRAGFWRHHDVSRILQVWAHIVGVDHVVVVTAPPSDVPGGLLWQRFASVLSLDPAAYDQAPDVNADASLGYAETELLRQVNVKVRRALSPVEYRRLVTNYLANQLLAAAPRSEGAGTDRPQLTPEARDRLVARADQIAQEVEGSGARVVGTLDDLRVPSPRSPVLREKDSRPADTVPATATHVVAELVLRIAELERELAGADGSARADSPTPERRRRKRAAADAEVESRREARAARRRARQARQD
ncbi:MAG: hypothetical protein ACR2KG_01475 [Nocardioidaceae bacterium]